jgi:hypothetical protein
MIDYEIVATGDFTVKRDDDDPEQATEYKNAAGDGAGTSTPAGKELSDATYTGQRHKSTEQRTRRTDLRTADRHASWREVASACHVEPGLGEE